MLKVRFIVILIVLTIPFFILLARNDGHFFYYEPTPISLSGVVESETFAGPPNYESTDSGDIAETHWFLKLRNSISVIPKKKDLHYLNIPEHNVTKIQIVIMSDYPFNFQNGKAYKVSGSLFHAISGHHHTAVLIELKGAKAIQ